MAVIECNRQLSGDWFELTLSGVEQGVPGQFFMLRPQSESYDPFFARPISIFDADESATRFVYQRVGRGTRALAELMPGTQISALGPRGNGFPIPDQDLALIGGGVGIAPLYYLAKEHKRRYPQRNLEVFLGFRQEPLLKEAYAALADRLIIDIGGYVTDRVEFSPERVYCACGPTPMMKAAAKRAQPVNALLYVSLEERMACGVGACLGCTVATKSGNRRACKDGPVFPASEVFYE